MHLNGETDVQTGKVATLCLMNNVVILLVVMQQLIASVIGLSLYFLSY